MGSASREVEIAAPKEKVWAILSDLHSVQHYGPGVTEAYYISDTKEGVGAARHCDLEVGGYVNERATEWNAGDSYVIEVYEGGEAFAPFEKQSARFVLRGEGDSTTVTLELDWELKPEAEDGALEIATQMPALVEGTLTGLKSYAEQS